MAEIDWENALLLQTSFLGDTVLTLPLVTELRRRFPIRRLTLLCTPMSRELLQDHPAIDEIIVDDKRKADRGIAGLRRKAAALRARGFTVAVTPHKSLRSAVMLAWAGIPQRIGFRQSGGWFLFHRVADRDPMRHDVERNLSVLEALGEAVSDCRRAIEFPLSAPVLAAVNQKLANLGAGRNKLTIGINPGSVWATKRWSAASFGELIRKLHEKFDCQVLLFGGADDETVVEAVQERCGGTAISLIGHIGLRELGAAISRCAVFVSNDSGPMHIAVGLRVPTVAIFCATTRELGFYPYTDNAFVVEKHLSCRPCASHGGRRCPLGTEDCIRRIDPASVLHAIERLLQSVDTAGASSTRPFQPQALTL
jgi:heptosyltransferase-2